MSWALFIVVLTVSFTIVRIGAIAFQLTGLEWSLAKFQSLSCFTGTGFTTKEAELITAHRQRRKIASVLMVLGNAGLVMMIATFASSLNPRQIIGRRLMERVVPFFVPSLLVPFVNLLIIIVGVYVIYRLFTHPKFSSKVTAFLRRRIIRKEIFRRVSFEELFVTTGGYGISKIEVRSDCPVLNKTLVEAGLRKDDITVLAIVRGQKTIPNPSADASMALGDELLCFGKLENIRNRLCPTGT